MSPISYERSVSYVADIIRPFFKKTDYLKEIIRQGGDSALELRQAIAGCSCLEYDRLFSQDSNPVLKVEDRIIYNNVGAFTMCLSPLFIRLFPAVYATNGLRHSLVRKAWQAENLLDTEFETSYI